jgi:PAS domain S-box-containing protein
MSGQTPTPREHTRQLSGETLQGALDAAGLGMFRWEIASGALDYDENFAQLLRAAPENLAGWKNAAHPDDRDRLARAFERCEREGSDLDLEFRCLEPNGTVRWLGGRGKTARDAAGMPASVSGACVEITRRKHVEEATRQSSERLHLALAAGHLGDWVWNAADDVITLSERAAEIFGLPAGESITWTHLRGMLHEEYRERARIAVEESLVTRTDYDLEYRIRKPSGEDIWIAARGRGTYTASGDVVGMIGVVQDISQRIASEDANRHSEQFNRTIVESSRDCIKTLALDGKLTWISSTGCRLLGVRDPSALVGMSYLDFWAGDDHAAAQRAVEAAGRGGTGSFVGTTVGAGSRAWNVMITPILGRSGEPASLLVVSRDVTERVEMERALREEARMLEVLHATGTTLTAQLDLRSLLQAVTDAATELCGAKFGAFFYNTSDEKGEAYQLVTLSGAPREAFERLGHPRATPVFAPTFRGEATIRLDDVRADPRYGQWAPHHGTPPGHLPVRSYLAVPVIARGGEVLGGLFFGHPDVAVFTAKSERLIGAIASQASIAIDNARLYEASQKASEERRRLLESERHARAHAERMSAMKDEFLAVLSHELRTPLSAILGWSQVMRSRAGAINAEVAKGLEIIERNARVQTQLIEDLLDMSRIVSGKMRLEVQTVRPDGFVEAAIEAVKPGANAKGIRLEVLLDSAAGPISGDASRLQQVMWNLLSNAIKFTPRGGRVQVLLESVNSHVEISVADTGTGISPDFLAHVFERFRQADASTTRKYGGLGLGLAIVKHLVELHGGSVHAMSAGEGRGSTFTVKLPLLLAHRGDEERRHPTARSLSATEFQALDLRGVKVVIADDEPDARLHLTRVLDDSGASVFAAGTPAEAVAFVEREQPDVLVTDIGMPDTDGFTLLRQVRALGERRGGRIPAIALTAFARTEDRTRALSSGFLVHLSKPVEPSELVATIASVAGRTP